MREVPHRFRLPHCFSFKTCYFSTTRPGRFLFVFPFQRNVLLDFLYLSGFCHRLFVFFPFSLPKPPFRSSACLAIQSFSTVVTKNWRRKMEMTVKPETTNTPLCFAFIRKQLDKPGAFRVPRDDERLAPVFLFVLTHLPSDFCFQPLLPPKLVVVFFFFSNPYQLSLQLLSFHRRFFFHVGILATKPEKRQVNVVPHFTSSRVCAQCVPYFTSIFDFVFFFFIYLLSFTCCCCICMFVLEGSMSQKCRSSTSCHSCAQGDARYRKPFLFSFGFTFFFFSSVPNSNSFLPFFSRGWARQRE